MIKITEIEWEDLSESAPGWLAGQLNTDNSIEIELDIDWTYGSRAPYGEPYDSGEVWYTITGFNPEENKKVRLKEEWLTRTALDHLLDVSGDAVIDHEQDRGEAAADAAYDAWKERGL